MNNGEFTQAELEGYLFLDDFNDNNIEHSTKTQCDSVCPKVKYDFKFLARMHSTKDTGRAERRLAPKCPAKVVEELEDKCCRDDGKKRMNWTVEMKRNFEVTVRRLGGTGRATPKKILRMMAVPDLSLCQVKSFLQKYRLMEGERMESTTSTDCVVETAGRKKRKPAGKASAPSKQRKKAPGKGPACQASPVPTIETNSFITNVTSAPQYAVQVTVPSVGAEGHSAQKASLQEALKLQKIVQQQVTSLLEQQNAMQAQIESQHAKLLAMLAEADISLESMAPPPQFPPLPYLVPTAEGSGSFHDITTPPAPVEGTFQEPSCHYYSLPALTDESIQYSSCQVSPGGACHLAAPHCGENHAAPLSTFVPPAAFEMQQCNPGEPCDCLANPGTPAVPSLLEPACRQEEAEFLANHSAAVTAKERELLACLQPEECADSAWCVLMDPSTAVHTPLAEAPRPHSFPPAAPTPVAPVANICLPAVSMMSPQQQAFLQGLTEFAYLQLLQQRVKSNLNQCFNGLNREVNASPVIIASPEPVGPTPAANQAQTAGMPAGRNAPTSAESGTGVQCGGAGQLGQDGSRKLQEAVAMEESMRDFEMLTQPAEEM